MSHITAELRDVHRELAECVEMFKRPGIEQPLGALEDAAIEAGKAWSGSWLGYQSRVYHANLQPPPPGSHFSSEWGFVGSFQGTTGDGREYDFDEVRAEIIRRAGDPDLGPARAAVTAIEQVFDDRRDQIVSILESMNASHEDAFIERLLEEAKSERLFSDSDFLAAQRPSGALMSRDTLAMTQGLQAAPHLTILAELVEIRSRRTTCEKLAKIALKAVSHVERVEHNQARAERVGTNVFFGHGTSKLWKDLKDFIQDRLHLPWDEFNRVPVAGVTNIARLSEMLDAAAIALIVMTGEDELLDGEMHARMNVIHEAGLFQGRLGFTKAIVLLEDGCGEFSNIQGLGQIRFPKGNIAAAFEEVRKVLEREGLLGP
jgi:predicted nucleotide-binding protein